MSGHPYKTEKACFCSTDDANLTRFHSWSVHVQNHCKIDHSSHWKILQYVLSPHFGLSEDAWNIWIVYWEFYYPNFWVCVQYDTFLGDASEVAKQDFLVSLLLCQLYKFLQKASWWFTPNSHGQRCVGDGPGWWLQRTIQLVCEWSKAVMPLRRRSGESCTVPLLSPALTDSGLFLAKVSVTYRIILWPRLNPSVIESQVQSISLDCREIKNKETQLGQWISNTHGLSCFTYNLRLYHQYKRSTRALGPLYVKESGSWLSEIIILVFHKVQARVNDPAVNTATYIIHE